MPFTGHEVWANADAYPHAMNSDDNLMIGRMRNCNDMGFMINPLSYMNASKMSHGNAAVHSMLNQKDPSSEKNANENLKRHGTVENISEVDESCEHRAKRSAYDFLINNVGNDGFNLQPPLNQTGNIVLNNGKKRGAVAEIGVDRKRFCMKDDDEMEIDGQSLQAPQVHTTLKPEDCMNLPTAATPAAGIVPSQDNKYQAQINPAYTFKSGSGLEQYLWQNNIQKNIVNSTMGKNTLYGSCYSHSIEPFEINASDDDVEFMYQATHGGNLLRHQSRHLGDDL